MSNGAVAFAGLIEEIFVQFSSKFMLWKGTLLSMLPNLVAAILIFTLFYFLSAWARRLTVRVATRMSHNLLVVSFIGNIVGIAVVVAGFLSALGLLHLERTVTSLLAGAGILGLAIGFAFQDLVANFISGVLIAFYKPFEVGNKIRSKEFCGRVVGISMRNTTMDTNEGERVLIPNKDVVQNAVVNYSLTGYRRLSISVKSARAIESAEVERQLVGYIGTQKISRLEKRVEVVVERLVDENIIYKLRMWLRIDSEVGHENTLEIQILREIQRIFGASEVKVLTL